MKLSKTEVEEIRATFSLFDKDGDGSISCSELAAAIRNLGQNPTEADIHQMIQKVDEDGNGKVEFAEFLDMMSKQICTRKAQQAEIKKAFKVFDKNRDGFITAQEFRLVMTKLGEKISEEEAESIVRQADMDGDGLINYEEFIKLMCGR